MLAPLAIEISDELPFTDHVSPIGVQVGVYVMQLLYVLLLKHELRFALLMVRLLEKLFACPRHSQKPVELRPQQHLGILRVEVLDLYAEHGRIDVEVQHQQVMLLEEFQQGGLAHELPYFLPAKLLEDAIAHLIFVQHQAGYPAVTRTLLLPELRIE